MGRVQFWSGRTEHNITARLAGVALQAGSAGVGDRRSSALKKTVHAKTPAKTSGSSAGAGSLETLRIDLIFFSKPQNSLVTTPIWRGGHINSMGIGALRH
jgi:hypothetical protein